MQADMRHGLDAIIGRPGSAVVVVVVVVDDAVVCISATSDVGAVKIRPGVRRIGMASSVGRN